MFFTKLFYNALLSVFLVLLTVFVFKFETRDSLENRVLFEIVNEDRTETIKLWKNDEGKCYVFLPSYADLANVRISLGKSGRGTTIYLDGKPLEDKETIEGIELSKEYILSFDKEKDTYPVEFLQSANVASMYVSTQSGNMDNIYSDKNNKEKASVTLYTSDGTLNYAGKQYGDSIKCRGNATFTSGKKPFLLNLEKPGDLLCMGSAKKWVLLANAYDPTNLRNKLVFDLAKKTSLKWTPDCEYVDLYLNGEYNGLYLLCEKVEVGENRLELKGDNDFLCKNELTERLPSLRNAFVTDYGRATEITFPLNPTVERKRRIENDVQLMENEILDELNISLEHLDLDSWVIKYLVDEITENIDADLCSSYFYCEYSNNTPRFYAGPIWDYDLTFGHVRENFNPRTFTANRRMRKIDLEAPYYGSLYNRSVFFNRLIEVYEKELLPVLEKYIDSDIDNLAYIIKYATNTNRIRWDKTEDSTESEALISYMKERISFLNDIWIEKRIYYVVQIETILDNWFESYAIKSGGKFTDCPEAKDVDISQNIWIDKDTGEEFDFNQPILKDAVLLIKRDHNLRDSSMNNEADGVVETDANTLLYNKLVRLLNITIVCVFILAFMFLLVQSKRQWKGKSK